VTVTQFSGKFAVDGLPYTSVSSIIKTDTKIVQGRKSKALSKTDGKRTKHLSATARGTAVHNAVRKFIRTGECNLNPPTTTTCR
jgi:1,4-alpha-glucan branching enzyme